MKVKLSDGEIVERDTALCCQAICFITLDNIHKLNLALPTVYQEELNGDCLTLVPSPKLAGQHIPGLAFASGQTGFRAGTAGG